MKISIKNMVCNRCIKVVRDELEKLDIIVTSVELGSADIVILKEKDTLKAVSKVLQQNGFELLENKEIKLVEKIKNIIVGLIYNNNLEHLEVNISVLLEKKIGKDYTYISSLFSSVENKTIEKYFIAQKIERVKELLVYGELSLSEVAYKLGYSSVQHLSNQFKGITGISATEFKKLKSKNRKSIDSL